MNNTTTTPAAGSPRCFDTYSSRKLRLACDSCHSSKIRCTGGKPCRKCQSSNAECNYSYTAKLGKPKGSRNKKTLEKLGLSSPGGKNSSPAKPKASSASNNSHESTRRERRAKKTNCLPQAHHDETENGELEAAATVGTNPMPSPSAMYTIPPPAGELELSFFQNFVDFDMPLFSPSAEGQGLIHPALTSPPSEQETWEMFCAPSDEFTHYQSWPSSAGTDDSSLDASANTSTITTPAEGSVLCTPPLGGYENGNTFEGGPFVEDVGCISPLSLSTPHEGQAVSSHCSSNAGTVERMSLPHTATPAAHRRQQMPQTSSCACLKELSDQLSHATALGRQLLGLDTALSRADEALRLAEDITACGACRMEGGRVLLPTMALLSKTFELARTSYRGSAQQGRVQRPAVHFGEWELSDEEDMRMVRRLLMSRTVGRASAVVGGLQLRTEEMVVAMECQFLDPRALHGGIQRLVEVLGELATCARSSGRA